MSSTSSLQQGLRQFSKIVDTVNDKIGIAASFVAVPIVVFILIEVFMRRFLNSPTLWGYEAIMISFGVFVIMTPAYGLLKGSLVGVDILSKKLQPRGAHILILVTYVIFFVPLVFFLLPSTYDFAMKSWEMKETGWSLWAPPLYPLKMCIPVGWALLALQGLSQMSKSVVALLEMK